MAFIETTQCETAQDVFNRAAQVRAYRHSTYGDSEAQRNVKKLSHELEVIKAERDQYRARCVELEVANGNLVGLLSKEPTQVIAKAIPTTINIKNIISVVSDYYRITPIDIVSGRRDAEFIEPRHVAIYLSRILTRFSLPQIGKQFGGRDHTTCHHAYQKIELRRQTEPVFDQQIKSLMARFALV